LYIGQFRQAVEVLEKVTRAAPDLEAAGLGLWGARYRTGDYDGAVAEAMRFLRSRGDEAVAQHLGSDYRGYGYAGAMKRAADGLATLSGRRYPTRSDGGVSATSKGKEDAPTGSDPRPRGGDDATLEATARPRDPIRGAML